ncbi:MAG TPA: tetratricopeptide repeat protein [Pyrinomonadaceae bacterium]|nr:tetratricopeptide repeat protein [Pyrinomonadaceae bacterium]
MRDETNENAAHGGRAERVEPEAQVAPLKAASRRQHPRRPLLGLLAAGGKTIAAAFGKVAEAARAAGRGLRPRARWRAAPLPPAAGVGAGSQHLIGYPDDIGIRLTYAGRTNSLIDFLTALRASLTITAILLLFTVLAVALWKELSKKTVVIDRIDLPAELEKMGYTSPVIAKKIADHIVNIKSGAEATANIEEYWLIEASPDIEVPQANISLKSSVHYLRGLFGLYQGVVNGEVVMRSDGLHMTVRVVRADKWPPQVYVRAVKGRLENIDEMLGEAAQHILHYNDPYVLAAYLYVEKSDDCLAMIQYTLTQEPAADDPWAYVLWASILEDHKDFAGAEKKYRQANETYNEIFQKEFHVSLNNLGNLLEVKGTELAEEGKAEEARKTLEEALSKYRRATELNENYALAHVGMGDVLRKLRRYQEAVESYDRSIRLDPQSPYAYIGLGDVLREEVFNFEEALAKYSVAAKLSYSPAILEEVNEKSIISYRMWAECLEGPRRAALDGQAAAKLAYVYKNWGDTLRGMGRRAEAISKYRRAAELDAELARRFRP